MNGRSWRGSPTREHDWTVIPPSRFDIVTAWFPEDQSPSPGPKLRPALVIEVWKSSRIEFFACKIAFGTKTLKLGLRQGWDLIIQDPLDLEALNLPVPTRFDLDHTLIAPWRPDFFGSWKGFASPIIGHLTERHVRDYAYFIMRR